MKRIIAMLLSLCMLLGMVSAPASAAVVTVEQVRDVHINELYAGLITEDDLAAPEEVTAAPVFYDAQSVVAYFREQMKVRAPTISFDLVTPASVYTGMELSKLWVDVFAHTGDPKEGDYIHWEYAGSSGTGQVSHNYKEYHRVMTYEVKYYTTAAQEAELDAKLDAVMASLNLEQKTDYEKFRTIYDYICTHVKYDHENLNDNDYKLKFTAYDALMRGTAVCQGYALLLYRMLLTTGIDCRLIAGTGINSAGQSGGHGWNIVKLGDWYYNVDSTWDTTYREAGLGYRFCLVNGNSFTSRHIRDEEYTTPAFMEQYPMSPTDFDPNAVHTHSFSAVVTAPTCTAGGFTTYTCTCGESYQDDETAPQGHEWGEGKVTKEPAEEAEGVMTYTCTRCDATRTEAIPKLEPVPFEITKQPEIYVGPIGSTASFHVEAVGDGLTYQWYYSPDNVGWSASGLTGNKTDTLKVAFTASRVGQFYRCEIRNAKGEKLTSDAVFMCEALPPITIQQQPESFMGQAGETGVFHVSATGNGLTYQWYYSKDNGVTWSKSGQTGSTTDTMKIQLTSARAGQCYRCEIKDVDGNILYSEQAAIKLETENIEIKYQPVSANGYIGETTTFHVEATGMGLTYQWYYSKDGGRTWSPSGMVGFDTDTLKVQLTAARVGQSYRCAVTDNKGNTVYSNVVAMNQKISVVGVLEIQQQPKDFTGKVGDTAVFYVDAIGENLVFQWQFSKDGKTWEASGLPGSKTDTLRVEVTAARIGQHYRCVITDAKGKELISNPVTLNLA